jgi:hypothetical protein
MYRYQEDGARWIEDRSTESASGDRPGFDDNKMNSLTWKLAENGLYIDSWHGQFRNGLSHELSR